MDQMIQIDEGRMKDIFTADQEGKSAEEIAKIMKLPLKTVKGILGESDAYDNERYEIRGGIAYKDIGNTPDKKNHVYAPDKKTAEKIFKQGKKVFREAGIKPYVSMQRDSKTNKMNYVVLDKDEKEVYRSSDERLAKDYLRKNFSKLREDLEEQVKDLEEQLKTAEQELEELYIKEDKAYVIRFKRIKDKERMVVVFRNQNDADMYADNIKKQGGQVFSNKLEKIPYKVVDKK